MFRGDREYLLDPGLPWHTASHYWGSGHAVTDLGAAQWATAGDWSFDVGAQTQKLWFDLTAAGLSLEVTRRIGAVDGVLRERYVWRNVAGRPVRITGLGVQTPWNDRYPGARQSLAQCVNAHVFAGGEGAWTLAVPMSGEGPRLGLVVHEGAVNAYSVESRNNSTLSNVRGHIVMQVTDHARNPRAFGGQPEIRLAPGESYALAWELRWYADDDSFLADAMGGLRLSALAAEAGCDDGDGGDADGIRISGAHLVDPAAAAAARTGLAIDADGDGVRITAARPGMVPLDLVRDADGRRVRTEVLFHEPLRTVIAERARYILAHQRAAERPGDLAGAFVPVDTRTGLRVDAGGWADWSDGSERIGMAVMLQRAWVQGMLPADLRDPVRRALDDWAAFARAHLIDDTGAIRRGSFLPASAFGQRIYDAPWMAELFAVRHRMTGDPADLDLAVRIVRRANELGAERFLAIGYAEVNEELVGLLEASGRDDDASAAAELRAAVTHSADHFLALGADLPAHEVSYEQSMVAPLVNLLLGAYRLTGDARYLEAARERLHWLLAFGGPQPDARLYGVALRHWDGYWFGLRRQYGDVFPHYWSALTATALARLPEPLRTDRTDALAMAIMRANMANYRPDGTATCAFVFPSAVDGVPVHAADPLANDQDWHLAIWLRLIDREGFAGA
ncbi:hypothetical protein GFD22_03815 [Bifidobacterium avesanii]|uniref:Uncharacterized protein n=1 Tax=Bifidobacterium avesanii TaxID=1798157 RepID=A0A7K3TG77_9BIFI|nr:hypothetical protein [Bifidobacterium avesanii]